ncbi:MAG: hypothetical protein QM690_09960 [Sphingobium sp.]
MFNRILTGFAHWLGETPLTALVAGHFWIVPALQTIHILAVAAVLVSVLLINLRVLGLIDGGQPVTAVLDRFLRPTGIGVLVLAATGLLLIAGEPTRAIFRTLFWVKMALIVTAFALTWSHRAAFAPAGPGAAATPARRAIALAALAAWLAVIVAGRWIAYVEAWPGAPE